MRLARRPPAGVLFALAVLAGFACRNPETANDDEDDNQFREDVIQCEEAVAKLAACCPDFDAARVLCNYFHSVDDGSYERIEESIKPALALDESACVLATPCEDFATRDVCKRAQEARTYTHRERTTHPGCGSRAGTESSGDTHPPVCP